VSTTTSKGGTGTAPKGTSSPKRETAPVSNKAPRIMVTDSNGAVESQVLAAGGVVIKGGYMAETAVRDLGKCDGLLITGGGDVNPFLYADWKHPQGYGNSTSRDLRELALLTAARELGIPVLGICRGMQIITVEAGGTLIQHVPDKVGHDNHSCSMMPVRTVRGSVVHRTLGDYPDMLHLHHQAVKDLPKGFQVTARHGDGTVEAIESIDGRVIGVQFHPESVLSGTGTKQNGWRLFEAFVEACARHRRRVSTTGRKPLGDAASYVDAHPAAVVFHREAITYRAPYKGSTVVGGSSKGGTSSTGSSKSSTGKARPTADPGPKAKPVKSARESALVLLKGGGTMTVEQADGDEIAAWCGPCGIPFDDMTDFVDHSDWFHPRG
jgi:putative glutamine amidotransferase